MLYNHYRFQSSLGRHVHGFYRGTTKIQGSGHYSSCRRVLIQACPFPTSVTPLHGTIGGSVIFFRGHPTTWYIPYSIIFDRDKIFLSSFWSEVSRLLASDLHRSSVYHPQTDGQTEVVNRCVETYLQCFSTDKPSRWFDWLAWAEYNDNTSFHTAIGVTLFRVVYGRESPPVIFFKWGSVANREVESLLVQHDTILEELKHHLHRNQQRMKLKADSNRRDVQWAMGDWVYVKLHPYHQSSLARRVNEKLAPHFYGPFKILERIGPIAYKLEIPTTTRIHLVFHASLLKRAVSSQPASPIIPSSLTWYMEQLV